MIVKQGDIVIFGRKTANGHDEHPAIVTQVWGEDRVDPTVNLKVFYDCAPTSDETSVQYWARAPFGSAYYYREP